MIICATCRREYEFLPLFGGLCFLCQFEIARKKLEGRVWPEIDTSWAIGCKTTTDLARAALKRPERFRGEHEVAVAWLMNYTDEEGNEK